MESQVGRRIFTDIPRPDPALVEQFRGIPSSNISDMMGRLYSTNASISPLNDTPLLGVAFTVKCPIGDNMAFLRALDLAQPGDVIVADAQGDMNRAICGEIVAQYCQSRGIAGVVVEGCIRDLDSISKMDFPMYCKGTSPQGPYKHGPGEINVPVCMGGQVVMPGDILVGDKDGIVVIRPEDAAEILVAAKEKLASEDKLMADYADGSFHYEEHEKLYREKTEQLGYIYCSLKK